MLVGEISLGHKEVHVAHLKKMTMNSGISFIKTADRVEVSVDLKVKRVSGPLVGFQAIGEHKNIGSVTVRRPFHDLPRCFANSGFIQLLAY